MRDDGATFVAIGRRLDRTYEAVRGHLLERKGTPELIPEPMEIPDTPRHCLRCKVEFMAFGRFNRLCAVCAQVAAGKIVDGDFSSGLDWLSVAPRDGRVAPHMGEDIHIDAYAENESL